MARIVLLDNHDSFVYNLADALATTEHELIVYRNTVPVQTVLDAQPDLIVLSPGPSHPSQAGCMMELIDAAFGTIPMLGICLGFQALLEHLGGHVEPCGPVHGFSSPLELTAAGESHALFTDLPTEGDPAVARYHSLGCLDAPAGMTVLATAPTALGHVVMAGEAVDQKAIGLQFHPESILTPDGPIMLERATSLLLDNK